MQLWLLWPREKQQGISSWELCFSLHITVPCHPSLSNERGHQQCPPARSQTMWLLVVAQVFCVLFCVGFQGLNFLGNSCPLPLTPRETRMNVPQAGHKGLQAGGWTGSILPALPPSLPPSASSLPLLQSKAPHFPHPKFLFFRITPSAWTSFMMYVQVNSLPRLGTRLCIRLSLSFGSRRASAHSLYTRTPWLDSPTTESLDCCYFKLSHLKEDNFLGGWGMIASKYSEFWTLLRNDLLVSDHEKHCFSIKGGVCVCVRLSLCLCVYVCVCGWLTFSGFLTWFKLLLSLCKEFISVQKNKCVVHSP